MWKLGGLPFRQLARRVLHGSAEDELVERASGLAFSFLLALLPILLVILALFGLFSARSSQLENSLMSHLSHLLPPEAFETLSKIIFGLAKNATRSTLSFDLALALWFGSGGISSMIFALSAAYRVRESRSWFRIRLIALGLTVAISILLLTALLMLILGGNVIDWVRAQLHLRYTVVIIWKGLQGAAAVLFVILCFSMIYYCRPSRGSVAGPGVHLARCLAPFYG